MRLKTLVKTYVNLVFLTFIVATSPQVYSNSSNEDMALHSMALYEDFGQYYFIVALHMQKTKQGEDIFNAEVRRRLELRITADKLTARKFTKMWVNGLAINCDRNELRTNSQHIVDFSTIFKHPLVRGDVIEVESLSSQSVIVRVNNVVMRQVDSPVFFDLLLRVIAGDVPLNSHVKKSILTRKANDIPSDVLSLYSSLQPSANRRQEVLAWGNQQTPKASTNIDLPNPQPKIETNSTVAATTLVNTKSAKTDPVKTRPAKGDKSNTSNKQASQKAAPSSVAKQTSAPVPVEANNQEAMEYDPFTVKAILAQRKYARSVTRLVKKNTKEPILVTSKTEKGRMRVTITVGRDGKLLKTSLREKAKNPAINKQIMKTLEASAPYPKLPEVIGDDELEVDVFFGLHWRYKYGG